MSGLTGTRELLVLNLRRDRLLLPAWLLGCAGSAAGSAAATVGLYPDEDTRVAAAELINATPALVAFYGPIWDPTSLGALSLFKLTALGSVMVALFGLLVVIRHTRADEEVGRRELLAGGALGRHASLLAGLLTAAVGSALIGLGTALALVGVGLPVPGSFAFGTSWCLAGLVFAGVGAGTAQLARSARAARGLAIATLIGAFLLRAVGDTAGGAEPGLASWLSPIGWSQQIRPFAGDRWPVALLSLAVALLISGLAAALSTRRDLGSGLLPQRRGRDRAHPLLAGPLGLAWRQQRASLVAWLAGFALLGLVAGQILSTVDAMLSTPVARQLVIAMGGVPGVVDAFVGVELSFVAVFASAYGIAAVLRLVDEETSGRSDLVLAGAVGRLRWAGATVAVALAGSALLLIAPGLVLGLAHAAETGDDSAVGRDLVAAAVRIPAVWVLVGVAVALYGLSRRLAPAAWGVLAASFLVSEIGPLLDLPEWVGDLSPYAHVPHLPGGELVLGPLVGLVGVAVAFLLVGLAAVGRRDVTAA
jgi:ABC-2 type transport system permease protein